MSDPLFTLSQHVTFPGSHFELQFCKGTHKLIPSPIYTHILNALILCLCVPVVACVLCWEHRVNMYTHTKKMRLSLEQSGALCL